MKMDFRSMGRAIRSGVEAAKTAVNDRQHIKTIEGIGADIERGRPVAAVAIEEILNDQGVSKGLKQKVLRMARGLAPETVIGAREKEELVGAEMPDVPEAGYLADHLPPLAERDLAREKVAILENLRTGRWPITFDACVAYKDGDKDRLSLSDSRERRAFEGLRKPPPAWGETVVMRDAALEGYRTMLKTFGKEGTSTLLHENGTAATSRTHGGTLGRHNAEQKIGWTLKVMDAAKQNARSGGRAMVTYVSECRIPVSSVVMIDVVKGQDETSLVEKKTTRTENVVVVDVLFGLYGQHNAESYPDRRDTFATARIIIPDFPKERANIDLDPSEQPPGSYPRLLRALLADPKLMAQIMRDFDAEAFWQDGERTVSYLPDTDKMAEVLMTRTGDLLKPTRDELMRRSGKKP